jgi:hypothetical protein
MSGLGDYGQGGGSEGALLRLRLTGPAGRVRFGIDLSPG